MFSENMGAKIQARAVLLAVVSAFAAAMHEVAWTRLIGRATGNTTLGVGLALTVFMVGSGAGALLAPLFPFWRRPRAAYTAAEMGIGVGALTLAFYCLCAPLPSSLAALDGDPALYVDVLSVGVVALVPAFAMGATYPLLVEASTGAGYRGVRQHYAAGLMGAVVGTLWAAMGIGPAWGLDTATFAAATLNVMLAALAWKWLPSDLVPRRHEAGWAIAREDRREILDFAAAGSLGLAAQVIWNRTVLPYAGVSVFTFAAIVAVYVLAQAAGFALYARWRKADDRATGAVALCAAPAIALATLGAVSLVPESAPSRDINPSLWFAAAGTVVLVVVAPTACILGISQASALARVEQRAGDWGRRAAGVAGLGTIASARGALLASTLGLASFGPRGTLIAASVPALAVVAISGRRALAGIALSVALGVAWLAPGPAWFLGPAFDAAPVYYAEHGVQDTTAVVVVDRPLEPRIRRLVSNGVSYSGDSIYAQRYMRLLAHLPALAARGEQRALVICVGTGTTLDALRAYDYDRIDAVDISPSITSTLQFFHHVSRGAHEDPRVRLLVEDGARYLRRAHEHYDVITLEPPPPRAPGASSLYSIEFYEDVRDHLRPGGAFAQWLPLHGMSGVELETLVRTFLYVFDHATLHLTERNEAVLLGTLEAPSGEHRAPRLERERVRRDLATIGMTGLDPLRETQATDAARLRTLVEEGPVVRDAWPAPEYAPLGGARDTVLPADAFVQRIANASVVDADSFAAMLLPAVPGFLRIERGRERDGDRARVQQAMQRWLERSPSDPYVQHTFGYGSLLRARLARLQSELPPAALAELRRRLESAQRMRTP